MGDKILVSNTGRIFWERIFIEMNGDKYLCVYEGYEEEFLDGLEYETLEWECGQPLEDANKLVHYAPLVKEMVEGEVNES